MKLLLASLVLVAASSFLSAADDAIVKNGDFKSKRFKYWKLHTSPSYTSKYKYKVSKRQISFENLKGEYAHYLSLSQYVDLKPDTNYTLSFEVKGELNPTKSAVVGVGRPYYAQPKQDVKPYFHLMFRRIEILPEWKTISYDFKTVYKTDNSEVTKRSFDVAGEKKKWASYSSDPGIAPTYLYFGFGQCLGDFEMRDVKIVEKN